MSTLDDINALFEDFGPPEEEKPQQIEEKIDVKSSSMGEVIKDFRKSKAPQFKGKSKKKKQEMAIAAKLQTEETPAPQTYQERLMNDVDKYISAHRKVEPNVKPLQEVPLDEERIKNIETKLDQVRLLFHEATMVSGIGQGGDGQTPGSGEVRILRMDDVYAPNGFTQGQGLLWDAGIGKFVPGASDGSGAPIFAVDQLVAGPGIDLNPPGGVGTVTISADLAVTDLRDVNGTPTDGDLLVYNSGNWVVGTINTSQLTLTNPQGGNPFGITRVDLVGPYTTQEDANQLFGEILAEYETRIDTLENATTPGTFLGAIDVTVAGNEPDTSTLNSGDYYIHDGATGALWGAGDSVDDGNQVIWDGNTWLIVSTVSTLAQLGDTDIDSAVTGDFLVYNDGTNIWESQTVPIPTVTVGAIQPNTGNEQDGDFWFDNANEVLYIYDSVWTVAGGAGGASVAISAVPPADPEEGNLWVSNDDWTTHVFDGFTWIALTNNGLVGGDSGTYVTPDQLDATVDTIDFNIREVQTEISVAVYALDQTHLRITPQTQLTGPLLLSDDDITDDKQAVTKEYVNDTFLPLSGGQLTGTLQFRRGNKTSDQFKISPNSSDTDYATNIYGLNNGQVRLRTSHTNSEGDHVGSHIVMDPKDGSPETKIYHVVTPTSGNMAANKDYVDSEIASLPTPAGVPVGSIMIWMNSTPPDGWFKMQGSDFDINAYPQLHAYLQNTGSYTTGKLPNWGGYFPGEWGESNGTGSLNTKQGYRTGQPSGGPPKSSHHFNDGHVDTANKAGGTNFADNYTAQVTIDTGWDDVTRPNTILVHYIIKHD